MAKHTITGRVGETYAVSFLMQHKYKIISTNFRSKFGEIDIIAKDGNQFVFVEVKTRSSTVFGTPADAITPKKLQLVIKAAEYFILVNNHVQNYRVDAIEVFMTRNTVTSINHIKNITF